MSAKADISASASTASAHPLRPISFGNPDVTVERRDDGTIYLRPKLELADYPVRLTDRLHHWASAEPSRVFMAERAAGGGWRQITYAQLLETTRRIASALIARGLSAERPIVILSGNSIDHALIALGALPIMRQLVARHYLRGMVQVGDRVAVAQHEGVLQAFGATGLVLRNDHGTVLLPYDWSLRSDMRRTPST